MAEPIIMPKLGFDMAEGTLINWTVDIGDDINKGDVIAEIETDKATIEIESTVGGHLLKLLAEPGDVVEVGSPIGYVGEEGEEPPEGEPDTTDQEAEAEQEEAEAEEEQKAEAPAEKPEDKAKEAEAERPEPSGGEPSEDGEKAPPGGVKASPIARRLADEKGIDLNRVQGSGPGGRVVKKDVLAFEEEEAPAAPPAKREPGAPPIPEGAARPSMPTFSELPEGPDVEIEELSRIRTRIGQRMVESKQFVPHFYVTTEIDIADAMALRAQLNEAIEDPASKISVNDLIVKATALTLRKYPNLNSHYYGDRLARHKRINIGIAVALPEGGLVNVTSYDADKTAIGTMAANHRDMIKRAREGKVKTAEIEGSTFSVSNLGPYDVDHFIAIINPPEAGILAVGSGKKVPVVSEDGSIGVGMRMKATISVDHRVSDGAEAAEFMKMLKDLLENPMRLLI